MTRGLSAPRCQQPPALSRRTGSGFPASGRYRLGLGLGLGLASPRPGGAGRGFGAAGFGVLRLLGLVFFGAAARPPSETGPESGLGTMRPPLPRGREVGGDRGGQ